MEFDTNLAAIHAYLCADGYVIKNPITQINKYYYIGLRNTCDDLLIDFENKFFVYFKVQPRRCKDGRSVVQNKQIYLELTKEFSYYCKEWIVPKLASKEMCAWLRAFFDCEGWVHSRTSRDRHIGADSANHKGLQQIQQELLKLHINTTLKITKKGLARLLIYGKENLERFQTKINFLHPKKKKTLTKAINSYKNYEWDFSNENKLLKKLLEEKKSKRLRINSISQQNTKQLSKILTKLNIKHTIHQSNNRHSQYYTICINSSYQQNKLREKISL